MEQDRNRARIFNIVVCIAGVICCVCSCYAPAPAGILEDESTNLVSAMPTEQMVLLQLIPALFMILACILVICGWNKVMTAVAAAAGDVLYGYMDYSLATDRLMFAGVLINLFGIILMTAGVMLQICATETGSAKVTRKAAKKRNKSRQNDSSAGKKDVTGGGNNRQSYDDIYMGIGEPVPYASVAQVEGWDQEDSVLERLRSYLALDEKDSGGRIKAADNSEITNEKQSDEDMVERLLESLNGEEPAAASEEQARAHMALDLEAVNQAMADFYEGIEDIFLDN